MTVMRYAILITLAIASLCAMVSAGADNGQRFLVDAGQSGAVASQEVFLWMLGGIAVVTTLSLWHFVVFGIPSAARRLVREQQAMALRAPDPDPDVGSVLSDEGESF